MNAIVRGSPAKFKEAGDKFFDYFDKHLAVSMARLYSPEKVAKRTKDNKRDLDLIMAATEQFRASDRSQTALECARKPCA